MSGMAPPSLNVSESMTKPFSKHRNETMHQGKKKSKNFVSGTTWQPSFFQMHKRKACYEEKRYKSCLCFSRSNNQIYFSFDSFLLSSESGTKVIDLNYNTIQSTTPKGMLCWHHNDVAPSRGLQCEFVAEHHHRHHGAWRRSDDLLRDYKTPIIKYSYLVWYCTIYCNCRGLTTS